MSKIIAITGASAGIGKAAAKLFAERGCKVYNLSRTANDACENILTDVTDRERVFEAVSEIVRREGSVDCLINCAGFGISGAIEDTSEAAARKIFDVNFFGTLFPIQAVIPVMRANGGGLIINLSSAGAPLSLPFQGFYSATKSAVISLTEALSAELKPFNVKVCALLPGDVKTEFTSRREKNPNNGEYYGGRIEKSVGKMERDEQCGMQPSVVAKSAYKLFVKRNPPVCTVCGAQYKLLVGLAKLLPKRLVIYIIGKLYG